MEYTNREGWGARYSRGMTMRPGPVSLVVAHHAGQPDVPPTATVQQERTIVRERLEQYQVSTLFKERPMAQRHIGYTWAIMPSGRIYEGVGWGRIGAHAPGVNSKSVGICIVMNAQLKPPTEEAVGAFRQVVAEGLRLGYIAQDYRIAPHSEFKDTTCPGNALRASLALLRHDAGNAVAQLPTLREGAKGEHVARLQRLLGMPADMVDTFGPQTLRYVVDFQLKSGLKVDGVVGPATWGRLVARQPPA